MTPQSLPNAAGRMGLDIRRQGRLGVYVARLSPLLTRVLLSSGTSRGLDDSHELSVLVCDGPTIRALNRRWRGIDRATNVLAFPLQEVSPNRKPGAGPIGDIAIAMPVARREARELGLDLGRHVTHLLIHGLLHLLGYDHQTEAQARRMENEERRLMALANQ